MNQEWPYQKCSQLWLLLEQGYDVEEIAEEFDVSKGEIKYRTRCLAFQLLDDTGMTVEEVWILTKVDRTVLEAHVHPVKAQQEKVFQAFADEVKREEASKAFWIALRKLEYEKGDD